VTRGRRLAFLPFLYDDAAAQVREANNPFLADGLEPLRPDETPPGTPAAREDGEPALSPGAG
jgi:hypothetical protein